MLSLKTALNEAIRSDVKIQSDFMNRLQSDIAEIGDVLATAYRQLNLPVTIDCSTEIFGYVALYHTSQNDDFDAYLWSVDFNSDDQILTLKYNSVALEDANPVDKIHLKEDKEEEYPATEAGYNQVVCRLGAILRTFILPDVKIAYFQEYSRRQSQQMLNFVI